jgi:hypothetical protein
MVRGAERRERFVAWKQDGADQRQSLQRLALLGAPVEEAAPLLHHLGLCMWVHILLVSRW